MAQVTNATNSSDPSDNRIDPVTGLYRMSRTAGVGLQDYAAINPLAVVALVLGVGSALVFISDLLIVIPALAVILGVVALVQVTRSNGTQTGRFVALLGVLLALGIGGYSVKRSLDVRTANGADGGQVAGMLRTLGEHVAAGDYDKAYQLFDGKFRERVSLDRFRGLWQGVQASPAIGKVAGMEWNNLLDFEDSPDGTVRVARGMVVAKVSGERKEMREPVVFQKVNGQWYIHDMPTFFPAEAPSRPGGPGGGPAKSAPGTI